MYALHPRVCQRKSCRIRTWACLGFSRKGVAFCLVWNLPRKLLTQHLSFIWNVNAPSARLKQPVSFLVSHSEGTAVGLSGHLLVCDLICPAFPPLCLGVLKASPVTIACVDNCLFLCKPVCTSYSDWCLPTWSRFPSCRRWWLCSSFCYPRCNIHTSMCMYAVQIYLYIFV